MDVLFCSNQITLFIFLLQQQQFQDLSHWFKKQSGRLEPPGNLDQFQKSWSWSQYPTAKPALQTQDPPFQRPKSASETNHQEEPLWSLAKAVINCQEAIQHWWFSCPNDLHCNGSFEVSWTATLKGNLCIHPPISPSKVASCTWKGQSYRQKDRWMHRFPLYFEGHHLFWGSCQK